MNDKVVIAGTVKLRNTIKAKTNLHNVINGTPSWVVNTGGGGIVYPHYSGSYTVTPSGSVQTLDTSDKVLDDDVTVQAVQAGSATTPATIISADPSISVSSGGLITATVSKTQQITPTVVEGYVSAGTAGNVGVSGSNTQQLSTQGAQTIYPSANDQSIASGKYLTGNQTFKAVTVSGLTADKVLQGNVIKIGDADDDDRIMSVTGTASGGITPTGTKSITANGTGIDVYSYQYADVAVPNSYSASDEGKVVSNGALVAQTSDTVTQNGTVDTTLINSLTVDVSGGGGISIDDFVNGTQPSGDIVLNDETTAIVAHALQGRTNVTSIIGRGVTNVGGECLNGCTNLKKLYIGGNNATFGSYAIRNCTNLEEVYIPKASSGLGFGGYGLQNCSSLEVIDFGLANVYLPNMPANTPLHTLILRRTTVATLGANGLNNSTAFVNGGTGGDIYIPKSLYDQLGTGTNDYKSATNWSAYDGYGTITWHAIEGSIYEL